MKKREMKRKQQLTGEQRRYMAEFELAITVALLENPGASDIEVCRWLDDHGFLFKEELLIDVRRTRK
jgi:hypothetical protein